MMRLDFQRKLLSHTERVKAVDFHPTEPWVIASHYNGQVGIWNYNTQTLVRSFDINDVPIRACAFIARKNWFVCGSDDFQVRVYNYNTGEKVTQFEAHPDYIRALVVHPTQPFLLTSSDDMTIKCFNWDMSWKCVQTFEGHSRYVMSLAINPKDTNTFASSCLDGTVKVWSFGSSVANFTLQAHDRGVNYVNYYPAGDKPYLITAGDDNLIKVWDYQTKACVRILEGHTNNVSFAFFHSKFPIIISGSEDGTVKIWHTLSYSLIKSYNFSLDRAWCIAQNKDNGLVTVGFDNGLITFSLGRDEPSVTMDSSGKVVWSNYNEVMSAMIRPAKEQSDLTDGSLISLSVKELGTTELYPAVLKHSPNGRFVSVCGNGEYIVYTALAWRNKAYGKALDFAWSADSNVYGSRTSDRSIVIHKNFKESNRLDLSYSCDKIFGGFLLGVVGSDFICFYDWDTGILVRKIDVKPKGVYWNDDGRFVILACDDDFYLLGFNAEMFYSAVESGTADEEEGVADSFEALADVSESVVNGKWVAETFIYTTTAARLNYLIGDQTYKIANVESSFYLLGYIPRDDRIYLTDRDMNVVSYSFNLAIIEYQSLVLKGDLEAAQGLLEQISETDRPRLSDFLSRLGYKEAALELSGDSVQRFELALDAQRLDIASQIAQELDDPLKWRSLGDAALNAWDFVLAQECFEKGKDYGSLVLLYTATNNHEGLKELSQLTKSTKINNTAFICSWLTNQPAECVNILTSTQRYPEANLFAATYCPDEVKNVLPEWKVDLTKNQKERIADSLGDLELKN
ncbi:putative coatomer subunit beta'' [Schizosaccharomyces pombe]|uniref:Probable coatomer subunit beta' n=1 Tax=Schizosaccharomyces pombe (strain 972 / ATCC 24843) TaxID=284812 RepID=COPB2_SCHPO|nr:putative coatomer beta' subunit protein [Schizosaccharomyces pombe]O42937.2 RecName: Full=Probable coatomer subunit beta'; AltName: Full=Beta'-coat protein; Short=Beta'-COP [Schizosaccharomyces pombe 972h-]CAA16920.2 coatomer beta' subunit (predicted) [Schizosaccharomyces pombe]|eukprot:NP_001342707.1 putative coatomer beta' subunit protein [Schizosaccharomyces pombe]